MAAKKKSFAEDINNPVLGFLDEPEMKVNISVKKEITEEQRKRFEKYLKEMEQAGYQLKKAGKTHRVQLVMTESLYEKARKRIEGETDPITKRPLSFNQYISNLIQADVDQAEQD